jgi:hypothetical protein
MTAAVRTTAVGVFYEPGQAERAVEDLKRAGFTPEQIGVAVRKEAGDNAPAREPAGTLAEEGAVTGVLTGGALGALAGAVATGLIPGVGPVLVVGLLAGILGGAGAGATAGGLIGGLIGHGIPEEEAKHYEQELAAGRTIVTVKADGRYAQAVEVLRRHGAYGKGSPLV